MGIEDFEDSTYTEEPEPEKRTYEGKGDVDVVLRPGPGVPEAIDTSIGVVQVHYIEGSIPFEATLEAKTDEEAEAAFEEFMEQSVDELRDELVEEGIDGEISLEPEKLTTEVKE